MKSRNSLFKERLDAELGHPAFSEQRKSMVLKSMGKPTGRLRCLLEREVVIPVKPIIAGALIVVCVFACIFTNGLRVTADDITKSRIVIVENMDGDR